MNKIISLDSKRQEINKQKNIESLFELHNDVINKIQEILEFEDLSFNISKVELKVEKIKFLISSTLENIDERHLNDKNKLMLSWYSEFVNYLGFLQYVSGKGINEQYIKILAQYLDDISGDIDISSICAYSVASELLVDYIFDSKIEELPFFVNTDSFSLYNEYIKSCGNAVNFMEHLRDSGNSSSLGSAIAVSRTVENNFLSQTERNKFFSLNLELTNSLCYYIYKYISQDVDNLDDFMEQVDDFDSILKSKLKEIYLKESYAKSN